MTPWGIAGRALDVFRRLFPDADLSDERAAQIRLAVAQANVGWNPQSILALAWGLELLVYMAMVSYGELFLPGDAPTVNTAALGTRLVVFAALLGLPVKQIAEGVRDVWDTLRRRG